MTNVAPLPAGFELGKSYEYGVDVNIGTPEAPIWQSVRRISDVNPTPTPRTQDAQTYDDLGADNSDVTGWSWVLAFVAQMNVSAITGRYLPEIEALLARVGRPGAKGSGAVAEVRWYHKPETGLANPDDAFKMAATVAASRVNTGSDGAVEKRQFTLTGKGPAEQIDNPWTGWDGSPAAAISTVTPAGQGVDEQVTISGTNFLEASDVKFGATSAKAFTVVSATTIVATLPTGSAGSVQVTVVTPEGTSAGVAYTRAV